MNLLILPIIIPFVVAVGGLFLRNHVRGAQAVGVLGAAIQCGVAYVLLERVNEAGYLVLRLGDWAAPYGIVLVADLFSALMVMITGVVGLAVAVYAVGDVKRELVKAHFFPLFHFLLGGVNGAFLTGDLFNLYVWFEVMLLASFVLMTMGRGKDRLEGGLKYLIINLVSSALFLAGVGLLYGKMGTLNMADIALHLREYPDAAWIKSTAMLLLVAFSIKAALFPFYFWLPASYHTPEFTVSAVFAGLLTKVGVYALIRAYTLMFGAQFSLVQEILIVLAAGTMISGVLGAASHFEVRRILSFHIISQIGYMIMGLAIYTPLAIAGAIFYTLHHIIVKTNLFLIAGIIQKRCGTTDLKQTGGLYRYAPWLAFLFFIPAFSLGGIPPLSGFWAKFGVIKAGLDAGHFWLVGAALAVGIFTLFSMTKIWAEAFWKAAPEGSHYKPANETSAPWTMVLPCVVLALITVTLGLWSQPLFEISMRASEQLLNPQGYIDQVLNLQPPTP